MLRTTIQTTDETGKELPIPADLRAQVQRAADILATTLREVGKVFDIEARWWFDAHANGELDVLLSLSALNRATRYQFPKDDLQEDDTIRSRLWTPINFIIPIMSAEVDRMVEDIRHRRLQELVTPVGG